MSVLKYIQRLQRIDFLLRRKATGNIESLANKLNLSRSATLLLLSEMKHLGFPITYCKKRKCYFYTEDGKMVENLFDKNIANDEMIKIKGGKSSFHFFIESNNIGPESNNFTRQ